MPPPPPPPAPPPPPPFRAAEPKYGRAFDPWNSVALGHQRAETKGPPGWRESRTRKLQSQLAAGHSGGARLSDAVGAGSEDFDEHLGVLVPKEVRARAANSVVDMLRRPGTMSSRCGSSSGGDSSGGGGSRGRSSNSRRQLGSMPPEEEEKKKKESDENKIQGDLDNNEATTTTATEGEAEQTLRGQEGASSETAAESFSSSKMFEGLVVYVNGSTHPLVSDHKLRHVLAENGARMAVHLGRRRVTHVVLGRPSGPSGGAGGGLAGGKLEREIRRVGGRGVKYVGVEW